MVRVCASPTQQKCFGPILSESGDLCHGAGMVPVVEKKLDVWSVVLFDDVLVTGNYYHAEERRLLHTRMGFPPQSSGRVEDEIIIEFLSGGKWDIG